MLCLVSLNSVGGKSESTFSWPATSHYMNQTFTFFSKKIAIYGESMDATLYVNQALHETSKEVTQCKTDVQEWGKCARLLNESPAGPLQSHFTLAERLIESLRQKWNENCFLSLCNVFVDQPFTCRKKSRNITISFKGNLRILYTSNEVHLLVLTKSMYSLLHSLSNSILWILVLMHT